MCRNTQLSDCQTLLVITVWLDSFKLNNVYNAKQKDNIALICSWMSDEWNVLKEKSPSELGLLCTAGGGGGNSTVHVDSNNSFLSILEKVARPVLSRPWDQLQ
jgi:hypothetical protein